MVDAARAAVGSAMATEVAPPTRAAAPRDSLAAALAPTEGAKGLGGNGIPQTEKWDSEAPAAEKKGAVFGAPLLSTRGVAAPILGPFSGPLFLPLGERGRDSGGTSEAEATLQVDRFLAVKCCPSGQTPLRINIDESSIRLWPGADPGTIAASAKGGARREVIANVSLRGQRGAFSFIAVVCDDVAVQRELPQFVVASERMLPAGVAAAFLASATHNLVLLRRHSAWLDAGGLCMVLRVLADTVHRVAPNRHCVLSMDVCPVHVSSQVLRQLGLCRLHFCPIAANMTRWLQPADVGVFRPFKQRIRQLHQQEQVVQGKAELDVGTVLRIIDRASMDIIVSRTWDRVFRLCGLADSPPTSRRFAAALGEASPLAFTSEVPNLEHLQALLPRRRFVPVEQLFPLLMRNRAAASCGARRPADSLLPDEPTSTDMPANPDFPWWGRTRSTALLMPSAHATSQLWKGSNVPRRVRAVPIACPRRPLHR